MNATLYTDKTLAKMVRDGKKIVAADDTKKGWKFHHWQINLMTMHLELRYETDGVISSSITTAYKIRL